MHPDEFDISEALVRQLLRSQFPQWADLPLRRVPSSGTVNILYRLGPDLMVRLPRIADFGGGPGHEAKWLPFLAPHLPLVIPAHVALGSPIEEYPVPWSIVGWIEGENATGETLDNLSDAAEALGRFVVALRSVDAADGPIGNYRGHGLLGRDLPTRHAIDQVADEFDRSRLLDVWEEALAVPSWSGPPTWFHGDLHSGNLLASGGALHAVIDFEGCSVGDPSSDLIAAWWLFDRASRDVFRATIEAGDDEWRRGRGWALSVALVALPYYVETNPTFADMARTAILEVLAESAH